ncbi:hypothetical protein B879_01738 [Cecembia lonarensis LW9]|uniref:Uncharacterized protein n=1 Tax=Cecembia lonarensis (strain CCUG 58316 / KCTC 22772 / LW9) TaxID=1225176 RepID=K1KZN7_CECL9|nr:hypothetical protein B879_01738 [Cecembia lonarensis LW9]
MKRIILKIVFSFLILFGLPIMSFAGNEKGLEPNEPLFKEVNMETVVDEELEATGCCFRWCTVETDKVINGNPVFITYCCVTCPPIA